MNDARLKTYWYPLASLKSLKDKPLKVKLLGEPLVIVRLDERVICLEDRCPHRNVPLSDGFVEAGHIRCGYHGWTFDACGDVSKIPGCACTEEKIAIETYRVCVEDGIIWVCLERDRAFVNPFTCKDLQFDRRIHFKSLKADFIHTIENFLDPTHTPFIHKGLLRTESKQRMEVSQELTNEGFVTYYTLLDKQNGLINKLFDNGVDTNSASFAMPGFAQIDYLKEGTILLRVAIFFVPHAQGDVGMVVCVNLPKSWTTTLKFWTLRPFMELAFYQDKAILEKQFAMQKVYNKPYCSTEVDFVVDHLIHLLANGNQAICKTAVIEL
jgi:phenylpropionate dioxygenase-like ring-hydroxylating dioxygenase large terminal subunit